MTQFNFSCDTAYPKDTLLNLRKRLLMRTGFAAQASNPPPGVADLYNDFLQEAQRLEYSASYGAIFRTKRWFTFPLVAGERFYNFGENTDDAPCTKTLNPEMIEWIGVSDGDDADNWYPLRRGIEPWMFNQMQESRPMRWQISQGIELWPPPDDDTQKLRVYGHFDLLPFVADTDYTTIDPDVVFLHALGMAKAHYKQADAGNAISLLSNRIGDLVAATHTGNRYIPRDMLRWARDPNLHNPGIFGSWGVRYIEDGSVRIVEEA